MFYQSLFELAGVAHLPKAKHLIESQIVIEGYKEAQIEFGEVAGSQAASDAITQYRELVNRNQVQGNERNIDYWRKQGWDAFNQFVQQKSQEKSKTQEKRSKVEGKSITIHEDSNWLVVVPIDKDASCFHGRNTDWCTTKPYTSYFEKYFYDKEVVLIYFLHLGTGDKWAIAAHSKVDAIEMFDKQDNSIDEATFKQQTGFDPNEYTKKVLGSDAVQTRVQQQRQTYAEAIKRIKSKQPFTEIDPQIERDLMFTKNAELCVAYATQVKGRWPEAERFIINSDQVGKYVIGVMGGKRSPEIESQIRSPGAAYAYAKDVVKRRWLQGEQYILQDPNVTMEYVERFTMEEDEDNPGEFINTWPESEQVIIKDPQMAAQYAIESLGYRWAEAEPIIMRDPYAAYLYARQMMKRRWPAAEQYIQQEPNIWATYKKHFHIN